ncbi:MAG: Uma2 family endonuclease [Anaerolineae bacterium]|nr:Uma2 family endonuclease [Anaerolineae bacterium]
MAIQEQVEQEVYGEIIATGVTLDEYIARYAADHCEWVEGVVIKVAPASLEHNDLIKYLILLLDTYFDLRPIGRLVLQPFVLHLPSVPERRREPDLLVVLNTNPHELKRTYMDGPADIVIEVVSEESAKRDHGEKFIEYEQGGVPEYWIIDPLRNESRFYRLDENGIYRRFTEDAEGNYQTPALPGLKVHVPTWWQDDLPRPSEIITSLREMLGA